MNTKMKGDLGEIEVARDLVRQGYSVSFPFGDNQAYDLIVDRGGSLERVQVKYTTSNGEWIRVKAVSDSITAGRVVNTKRYTTATIDWLAVYDRTSDACYYLPATLLGVEGKRELHLRLTTPKTQSHTYRYAYDFCCLGKTAIR